MAVPAGRTNNMFGWNSYEWAADYKYVAAGWTVTPTPTSKNASIALTPPTPVVYPLAGAVMGVLYGRRTGQGYDGKSTMVAAAAPGTVVLRDLQNATQYYVVPIMRTADGNVIRGPESGLLTLP